MRSRSDNNQAEIVDLLRAIGVDVEIHSAFGLGYDLLCHIPGRVFIVEVKPADRIGAKGQVLAQGWKFTDKEQRLYDTWGEDYHIVKTVQEAAAVVAYYKMRMMK